MRGESTIFATSARASAVCKWTGRGCQNGNNTCCRDIETYRQDHRESCGRSFDGQLQGSRPQSSHQPLNSPHSTLQPVANIPHGAQDMHGLAATVVRPADLRTDAGSACTIPSEVYINADSLSHFFLLPFRSPTRYIIVIAPGRGARKRTPCALSTSELELTLCPVVLRHVQMVNVPKTRRTYCKGKQCRKHTPHKVTQYKTGKASLFAQGKRRYDRKQSGALTARFTSR